MAGPEKTLEVAIMKYLEKRGLPHYKLHSGTAATFSGRFMRLAPEGSPDIVFCGYGLFVGLELKDGPGELAAWERQWERYQKTRIEVASSRRSIKQHEELAKIRATRGIGIAVGDFEEFQRKLLRIERFANAVFLKGTQGNPMDI